MALYSWLGIDYENNFFKIARTHSHSFSPWVKYNLPDAMWLLSFLLLMESIWGQEKRIKWLFCLLVIIFAICLEIAQLANILPGTGDVIDLFFYAIAIIIFLLITKQKQYEKNN